MPDYPRVGPAVVHLVGRITNDVFSFLGPLTQTLAARGIAQVVIARDTTEFRHNLSLFDERIRLVILPAPRAPFTRLRLMRQALVAEASSPAAVYCHLHGIVPSLVGAWASRVYGVKARLLFSPHGSRSLGPLKPVGSVVMRILRSLTKTEQLVPIVNTSEDARRVARFSNRAVTLIESPVADAFFQVVRLEATTPTILAGVGLPDRVAAVRFAQLAVLLWDERTPIKYAWVGPVDAQSAALLQAAGVVVHAGANQTCRAELMALSWCFLALGRAEGFTSVLAEAMAAGMPCVAWDHAHHRNLLTDGLTGVVAADEVAILTILTALVGSADARRQMGLAARTTAALRFNRSRFDRDVLETYTRNLQPSPANSAPMSPDF